MAKSYGGKYSPGAPRTESGLPPVAPKQRLKPRTGKVNALYAPAMIVAFTSLNDGPVTLILSLAAAASWALAAWLTKEGMIAEAEYEARKVARRPALPRKMIATGLFGIGTVIAAYSAAAGVAGSLLYGVAAAALHVAAFGIDPLRDKRIEGVDAFQQDRVAKVVVQAEEHMTAMRSHIATLGDRALTARVEGFLAAAGQLVQTVQEDPRDLSGARKYLTVYLRGADNATAKFVTHYTNSQSQEARSEYEALLTDLETNFAARRDKMLENDADDMEIEIKVLRDRLQREGL